MSDNALKPIAGRPGAKFRWIEGPTATPADWDKIDTMLAAQGWSPLNRKTTRILVVEENGKMGFIVAQMVPYVGPGYVPPSLRGTGLSQELADRMDGYLKENNARGWMVIADSPHVAKLYTERGMRRIESPVFMEGDFGAAQQEAGPKAATTGPKERT